MLLELHCGGQQDINQLNQALHCPKHTHLQKWPTIWKFRISWVQWRPLSRGRRRLPAASADAKLHQSSIYYYLEYTSCSIFLWKAFQHQNGGQGEEEFEVQAALSALKSTLCWFKKKKKPLSKMPVGKLELPTAPQGQSNLLSSHLCGFQSNSNFSVH